MSPADLEVSSAWAAVYAVSVYGFCWVLSRGLLRFGSVSRAATPASNRYGALDGLRGFLAVSVLVHHSFTAYVYFTTGRWESSTSPLLNHLGQTAVALFFMITGFLFTLRAVAPTVDWPRFYLSRLARVGPLHVVVILLLFGIVLAASGGVLKESLWKLTKELGHWLTLGMRGWPDINGYPDTPKITAWVHWTLQYEILFYLFWVPGIHLAARCLSPNRLLILTGGALSLLLVYRLLRPDDMGPSLYATHFMAGVFVAQVFQQPQLKRLLRSRGLGWMAGVGTGLLLLTPNSSSVLAVACAIVIFAAVAGGASLFGLLHTPAARWLGDISYGTYLLHGMALWLTFKALGRAYDLQELHLSAHWGLTLFVTAAVLLGASASYIGLERPIMKTAAAWNRRRLSGASPGPLAASAPSDSETGLVSGAQGRAISPVPAR